ncbi:MAG TPA: selenocysteine-specific translation elongation factor [Pyrinomonadaceae bacterium]|nr:selenocysteine-specific translation elongation factor [Pyrinomonadaceae bacterium]
MKSIIVGTAGHIDHGKTALVRALTGIDADRLPEEKQRGITIDIGFADLDLGDVRVGFVDVPGHERFVKNMLAGAHGIDVVALVIAADESVMPQTREHFEICRLLDVRSGLIVLTKKDLVDEEMLGLVQEEVREMVGGSFLEGAPIVSVSSRTSEGLDELKSTLREVAGQIPKRSDNLITRLPIDRAFTMSGFGAVVTGTLISGEIDEGSEMELLPQARRVRVRGLQVHGTRVKRAYAGQRTAVNLGGVETSELERGMVLAPVNRLLTTQIADVHVQMLSDAQRALRSRQRVRVHLGAAEILARVRVLSSPSPQAERGLGGEVAGGVNPILNPSPLAGRDIHKINPGKSGFAQLRFEAPVVCVLGDRFVIRSYSPQRTIGGGMILDAFATRHRARELTALRERLTHLVDGTPAQKLAAFVANAEERGLSRGDLMTRTAWRDEVVQSVIDAARGAGSVAEIGGQLLSPGVLEQLKRTVVKDVAAHHQAEPLSRGLALEVLRGRHFAHVSAELFRAVLAEVEQAGALVVEKDVVRKPEHTRAVSGADAALRDRLEAVYREAALAAPSMTEAFTRAGINAGTQKHGRKVLQVLIDAGSLVRVDGEMFFHRDALEDLKAKLRSHAAKEKSIDVPTFKELAGISRKYAIPLLEYFDRERVTRREGDRRVILL